MPARAIRACSRSARAGRARPRGRAGWPARGGGQPAASRAVARLEGRGQLDERVGDVGVAGPLGLRVQRQRAPARLLGRGDAAGAAARWRARGRRWRG